MKRVTLFFAVFFVCLTVSCQTKTNNSKVSDFTFKSIFGTNSKEPDNVYCLLGTGFFRAPHSGNSDSLIYTWIENHPNALVVPVSSFGPVETAKPQSEMIYCWVIAENDTLNNYLIKNGCFSGGTMMRPKTWEEMEEWEKELYEESDEKPNVKVYVSDRTYEVFIEQIISAEINARSNKNGIWRNTKSED